MADKHDKKDDKKEKKGDKKEKAKKVVLVTGITGNTGAATLKHILAHPKAGKWTIRAGARDVEKGKAALKDLSAEQLARIQFVKFDSEDDASLKAAFAGATSVVLVLPSGITNVTDRDVPLKKQVDGAIAAGVPHIVTISALVAACPESEFGKAMGSWLAYVEANKARGLIDLRPNFFLENLWGQVGAVKSTDSIYLNLTGSSAHIAVADIGAFAAAVALKGKKHVGQVYNLSGSHSETIADIAAAATRGLGREIKGVSVPREAAVQAMLGMGLPQNVASGSADLFEWSNKGFFSTFESEWQTSKTFVKVVGREQITTEQWFKNVAPAFAK